MARSLGYLLRVLLLLSFAIFAIGEFFFFFKVSSVEFTIVLEQQQIIRSAFRVNTEAVRFPS